MNRTTPPGQAPYLIIGAGVHGLSTAWHLAKRLRASGRGDGSHILVVDKSGVAAGASGIACGIVRNNYYQPAMRELMAHSVAKWEEDPVAYHYHDVGYLQISPDCMSQDVASIHEQQRSIGYASSFIDGKAESAAYMRSLFGDWRAEGVTSVLHEHQGGYAHNRPSMEALAAKARAEGVRIVSGVAVTGFDRQAEAIRRVHTDGGTIDVEHIVVAVGPWIRTLWDLLGLPASITVVDGDAEGRDVPMWRYLCLQEGTLGVDPDELRTDDGRMPPVVHLDTDAPLNSDVDGALITEDLWGIYYKPDSAFGGVQGGSSPWTVEDTESVEVDPYGVDSKDFVVGDDFRRMWCSGLAFCHERFRGRMHLYKDEPSGGLGCFTPDSFPVFDRFGQNVYVIADSNHGYKMLGVGDLVAGEILGQPSKLLEPFRFSRYAEGRLHPVSSSPFPWS